MRQLELELGVRLFDRTTRRVQLSPAGLALHADAARAFEGLQALSELARRLAKGEAGTLRVGYMIGAGIDLMPSLFTRFSEAYPLVTVETTEYDFSDPTAGLLSGAVDAAVIRPPVDDELIEIQVLAEEPRVVSLPEDHPLAGRATVAIREILDEPIIAAPRSAGRWRDYWLALDQRDGVPPVVAAEAATREAELQAVAMGRGISITSGAAARYYVRPGHLLRRDRRPRAVRRRVGVAARRAEPRRGQPARGREGDGAGAARSVVRLIRIRLSIRSELLFHSAMAGP